MSDPHKNFGVPRVDYTPMGAIGMEGDFLRGLTDKSPDRPKWVRCMAIIFCIIFMLLPGIFMLLDGALFLYVAYTSPVPEALASIGGFILIAFIGAAFTAAGIMGIKANVKTKKSEGRPAL